MHSFISWALSKCRRKSLHASHLMMGTKIRVCVCINLVIVVSLCSTYFTFIHHPPPEEILQNQKAHLDERKFELEPHKTYTMAEIAEAAWGKWLSQNNYVPIGNVYDGPCDSEDRIIVGKLVVLLDSEASGVKVGIYTNTSLDTTIVYGKAHVYTLYNGNELYNNGLDLCTAEDGDEDRVFKCPVAKGTHFFKKEWKVSPLLPKGEYDVKVSISNQQEKTVLCSHFSLTL